jgi:hypothetical protein
VREPLGVGAAHSMAVSVPFDLVLTVLGGFGAIVCRARACRRNLSSPAEGASVGEVRWGAPPASAEGIDGKATQT